MKYGLVKTGKKADLINRLNGPRPPSILLERKAKGCYVPSRHNTCATALLVALYLEQEKANPDWNGMTKDELYALAESLEISKDPFSGVFTGQYKHDGWSSMSDNWKEEGRRLILPNLVMNNETAILIITPKSSARRLGTEVILTA